MFIAKTLQAIFVLALVAGLAACGGTTTDDSTITSAQSSNSSTNNSQPGGDTDSNDSIPPTSPANLRNATSPSSNQVSLVWTGSTDNVGVVSYRIYRNGFQVGSTTNTSYVDNTVQPASSYNFYVAAFDAAGNSANSNTLVTNTPAAADTVPPTAPGNVHSTGTTTNQISIAWNASSDNVAISGYRIFRNSALVGTTTSTSFTDTGLNASTTYQYIIQAYDSSNNATNSGSVNIATQNPVTSSVTLSWENPTRNTDESCIGQLDGYRVYYGTSSGNYTNSVDIQPSTGSISCVQTGFDNACSAPVMTCSYTTEQLTQNTWYFAVRTYDTNGILSNLSNEATRTIN